MEFLRSREFRLFIVISLGVLLLALLITIPAALIGRRRNAEPLPVSRTAAQPAAPVVKPESMLLPEVWNSPRPVEPVFFRKPIEGWNYSRIEPFWISPEMIRYETLKKESDRAVWEYLEPLP
jgi:hypothetical protein